jgi:cytochrome c peroxidase
MPNREVTASYRSARRRIGAISSVSILSWFVAVTALASLIAPAARSQTMPSVPANAAPYLPKTWRSSLSSPLPAGLQSGAIGPVVSASEFDPNASGLLGSYQPGGPTVTASNAFFQSLGTNGRSCATCHQPASGMSISLSSIQARYASSAGSDPIFAPVDGANCPSAVPSANTKPSYLGRHMGQGKSLLQAHSLILGRGLFRIFLPVPANAQFTIKVISDPYSCNTDPNYDEVIDPTTGLTTQIISVYRRPRISTNLDFVTTTASFPGGPPPGPSGNIMWDGREPTLQSQAMDATLTHAQATQAPSDAAVAQMVAFENGIFSAQSVDFVAGPLTAGGALGGPVNLSGFAPAVLANLPSESAFTIYNAWMAVSGTSAAASRQASIYRGQEIFNTFPITISNVAGLNTILGNPTVGTCHTCHNQTNAGSDSFPGAQQDLGVGGDLSALGGPAPDPELPIFELDCNSGSTVYNGMIVRTNDPGRALITGNCADIGLFTVSPLRALAAHAPYFHDGSAANMLAVVNFYNSRFSMGLSLQNKVDLVNFLNVL